MELIINGVKQEVKADPSKSLLEVLRDDLDLTGSKYGCGEGECGACTVLLEGTPIRSCNFAAGNAVGKQVTTIEGLAEEAGLHPLQEAFLEADAFQCGYCTSGMIVSGVALLNKSPEPSRREIVNFMQGNICRCGVYPRIITAIIKASETLKMSEK